MIAVNGPDLARPGLLDDQITRSRACDFLTLLVKQSGFNAEERETREPRFECVSARERRNHDAPRFCLPPSVDNRTPAFSYNAVVPLPRFWINRFSD